MSLTLEMPEGKKKKSTSKFKIVILILILLIVGFFYWLYSGRIVSNDGELSAGFVPVPSPMSSSLAGVMVEANSFVQKGQLLAKLETAEYFEQIAAAKSLVQGALTTSEITAERVAKAQKAAEEMVERIALARHEENALKHEVEKLSTEHAKAQLQMRDLDAKGAKTAEKDTAKKAEFMAAQKLHSAKANFEHASQSRAAIETELHKIRNENNNKQGLNISVDLPDPSLIHAPINGYLTKNIPLAGQKFTRGEAVFQIIPESGAKLFALAKLENIQATSVDVHKPCFVLPNAEWKIYSAKVVSIDLNQSPANISINFKDNVDVAKYNTNSKARVVFWNHPLAENSLLYPIFMILSYIP